MFRADVGSAYAVPETIIPDLGQVAKDGSKSSSKDSWDVFQHDDCGSKLANKSDDLRPETASRAFDTSAFSSVAKVLAWESGADCIDWSINVVLCEFGYIGKARDVWPPFSQDSAREWFNLAKGHGFKTIGHFSANAEAADAAKKVKQSQLLHWYCRFNSIQNSRLMPVSCLIRLASFMDGIRLPVESRKTYERDRSSLFNLSRNCSVVYVLFFMRSCCIMFFVRQQPC
jgi:hypothetical protein